MGSGTAPVCTDLEAWIASGIESVDALLDRLIPSEAVAPARIHAAMRHSVFAGGKRMRPLLVVAAAEACGGLNDAVLHAACAIEMVHTFSLIHDDLPALDNDDLRRGLPTCHVAYGEDMAILAGDALHTLAFAVLAELPDAPDSERLACIRLLADTCGTRGMVGGQVDDLLCEGKDVSLDHLRSIHARKTGELLRASVLSGAILSGADANDRRHLDAYARHIGVAFQIVDDILDLTSDAETLGKPAQSDLRHDKATYPKFLGLEGSRSLAEAALESALEELKALERPADRLADIARYVVDRTK